MRRPIIGIAGGYDKAPPTSAFPTLRRMFTNEGYVSKLEQSGASVIVISVTDNNLEELVGLCDGILIPGGPDIDPSWYGQTRRDVCGTSCMETDRFQLNLYHTARNQNKPVFGICRGCQLINVAEGGTLFQDYRLRKDSSIVHPDLEHFDSVSHQVMLDENGLIRDILGTKEIGVNSLHHQCIDALAPNAKVLATSKDGSIEAIQIQGGPWCLAVQWHPESMGVEMLPLFQTFIEQTRS